MADNDTAVTTTEPAARPVTNGFDRLATAARTRPGDTATGPPAPERSAGEPRASESAPGGQDAVLSADSARRLLLQAAQALASGAGRETAMIVRGVLGRPDTQAMATALRALAAEGRARAGAGDEFARMLRAAKVPQIAAHFDAAADAVASAGITVPDRVATDSPEHAVAVTVFDALGDRLRAMTPFDLPRAELSPADLPLELKPEHVRGLDSLRRQVRQLLQPAVGTQLPPDVVGAVAAVNGVLVGTGFENPARAMAQQVVGLDRPPLPVAARIRQFAGKLDALLPTEDVRRTALGSYERGRDLPAQLRAVAAEVERIAANPDALAQARVVMLLGDLDVRETNQPSPHDSPTPTGPVAGPETPAHTEPERREAERDAAVEEDPQMVTPYRYNPELLPEHALLGSLLHTSPALNAMEEFLGARDFATPDTRALYTAIRGMHHAGVLINVAEMPSEARMLEAAHENCMKLYAALRADPPPYGTNTISDIPRLIGQITAAAPAESVPYRGVYDPGAQMRLGRMVLEDSIRRQLGGMGVAMERAKPLVAPDQLLGTQRGERAAQKLVSNLETIESQVEVMAQRLVAAVKHTGPDQVAAGVPYIADDAVTRSTFLRSRMPERLRPIAAPLLHRAERHIIHLALYAGKKENLPETILKLAPEDFSSLRHANTWRAIKDLHAQGLPANYVAVDRDSRAAHFAHHPILSHRALVTMGHEQPKLKPERVARSLRTLVSSALARAKTDSQYAIAAVTTGTAVPVESALVTVKNTIGGLSERAATAVKQHREITQQQAHGRHSSAR